MTPEQLQRLAEHRSSWFASWRSCEPAKRDVVESAIADLYRAVDRKPPLFIWAQSPAEAVSLSLQHRSKLRCSMWSSLRNWQSLTLFNWNGENRNIAERMADFEVQDRVFDSPDFPEDKLGINFHYRFINRMGQVRELSNCATLGFVRDVLGQSHGVPSDLDARSAIARQVWHWWPFKDACIVCERPARIVLDDEWRLHSLSGPVITYRDGWCAYAVRGTVVPAAWIKSPREIPIEAAFDWPNIEQRRIAAELIGWNRVIERLNPVIVDENPNPEIGTLLRITMPGDPSTPWLPPEEQMFLRVRCGTGREFVLPVPPNMQTALQANAWTYDVPEDELLKLEVRT